MRSETSSPSAPSDEVDRDTSISHLSVVLAHRLRGLVAGIEGFADLLTDTLMEAEQRDLAMKIMEGTARIESILADLQLYGESLDPVMLPIRVDEVMRDVLVPLDDAHRTRVEVDVHGEASARMMLADPFLLRQGLLILMQNALEAVGSRANVRLTVTRFDEAVEFAVWNDGIIAVEDAADVVFTPFFTTKAHNLGVGLSIVRRIARLHDATVELVCNDRELGTCFAFTISDTDGVDPL